MHPQTAAWLKDLDFTDSDEVGGTVSSGPAVSQDYQLTARTYCLQEPPLHPSVCAEDRDTGTCSAETLSTSQHHGQSLASLPAEVLFFIIDHLELPALACLIQTCKDLRATCMTDCVWENVCNGEFPKVCAQSQRYHKLRLSTDTSIRPSVIQPCVSITLTAIDDTVQTPTATLDSQPEASSCSHSQRYSFFDSNLRLRYSGGLVVEPAWLSLLPKVSCQGAGWLYLKGKTLSGIHFNSCCVATKPSTIFLAWSVCIQLFPAGYLIIHFSEVCEFGIQLLPHLIHVAIQGLSVSVDAGLVHAESSLKGCSSSFRHTHHHVRSKLHSLWLMGEVNDNLLLQRTLLKLTSMSTHSKQASCMHQLESQFAFGASLPAHIPSCRCIVNGMQTWLVMQSSCVCRIKLEQDIRDPEQCICVCGRLHSIGPENRPCESCESCESWVAKGNSRGQVSVPVAGTSAAVAGLQDLVDTSVQSLHASDGVHLSRESCRDDVSWQSRHSNVI